MGGLIGPREIQAGHQLAMEDGERRCLVPLLGCSLAGYSNKRVAEVYETSGYIDLYFFI